MKKYLFLIILVIQSGLLFSQGVYDVRNPEITSKEIYEHIKYLASDKLEGRYPGSDGGKLAEDYLVNEFLTYGLTPAGDSTFIQPYFHPEFSSGSGNIIGYLEGNDPLLKNEVIVVGGHYDHLGKNTKNSLYAGNQTPIHYGADDNASGTTGVLELAQKFANKKSNLKRSLLFICFTGEEEGLLGSSYFVKSDLFKKYNIIAMINMDMIGRMKDNKLIVGGTGTSPIWTEYADEVNKDFNLTLTYNPEGFGPSDHSSFYGKNIPVLFFFTDLHADYHKPTDTYDKINTEGEAKVIEFVAAIINKLDEAKEKPVFTKVMVRNDENKEKMTYKVYVGTVPDFSTTTGGYKISGVQPQSPAEIAGMQAGDAIIKFGNKDVDNIYDFTAALSDLKPDDEVEVVVNRNGEIITMKLIVGKK